MRILALALIAMKSFPLLPARAAEGWVRVGSPISGYQWYTLKQDFTGRFRIYLTKSKCSGSGCSNEFTGIVFTMMADCEDFRYRFYDIDRRAWGTWNLEIHIASLTQSTMKYVCT